MILVTKKSKVKPDSVIKFCPKCGSTNISLIDRNRLLGAIGISANYVCVSCGYTATIFPEAPHSKIKNIQKDNFGTSGDTYSEVKQESAPITKPTNSANGFFVVRIWWKLVSLLFFVLSIILLIKYFFGNLSEERNVLVLGLVNLLLSIVVLVVSFRTKRLVNK